MSALNFDAFAALAEIESAAGLRDNEANGAKEVLRAPTNQQTLAPLSLLAFSPHQIQPSLPECPALWQYELKAIDPATPPVGIDQERWSQLVEDARWLAELHGGSAAALGWTGSNLFGLDSLPRWGGLSDRLEGARRVTFTNRVAHWRSGQEEGWLWRRTLRPMRTLWEL